MLNKQLGYQFCEDSQKIQDKIAKVRKYRKISQNLGTVSQMKTMLNNMDFIDVGNFNEEGDCIVLISNGTVLWGEYKDGVFVKKDRHQEIMQVVAACSITVAPYEYVEQYDSIWKYVPDERYKYAVLDKHKTLCYFTVKPVRLPNGRYTVNRSPLANRGASFSIENVDINLPPDYEIGSLVRRVRYG